MRKKVVMLCLSGLLCMNQFNSALYISAAQADSEQDVQIGTENLYVADMKGKAWDALESEKEKFVAAQLNTKIVSKLDTDTLLKVLLNNPMLYTIEDSDDRMVGAGKFLDRINAGKELIARTNLKDAVVNEYLKMEIPYKTLNDYSEIDNCKDGELNATIMRLLEDETFSKNLDKDMEKYYQLHFLEGLILNEKIYNSLSVDDKRKIYTQSLKLIKEKQTSEVFSYSAEASFSNLLAVDRDIQVYASLAKARDFDEIPVWTPKNTKVIARKYKDNHVNSAAAVASYAKQNKNRIIKVVAAGYTRSNCHAYTWAGDSSIWIQDPQAYVSDGSYRKVQAGGHATREYQKVYQSTGHSAIVVNIKGDQIVRTKRSGSPIYEAYLSKDFGSQYEIYDLVC